LRGVKVDDAKFFTGSTTLWPILCVTEMLMSDLFAVANRVLSGFSFTNLIVENFVDAFLNPL